jgi:teichuronic acid biosynthesis glycosyltransferase TuaC
MRILVITTIFPNAEEITKGVYIFQIAQGLSQQVPLAVIAPIPYSPWFLKSKQYAAFQRIPRVEEIGGIQVYHPRYLVIPKVMRSLYGLLYFISIGGFCLRLRKEFKPDQILSFWAYPDGFASVLIGKMLRLPVTVGCRGCDVNTAGESFLRKRMVVWALRQCRNVLAVSQAMGQVLQGLTVPMEQIAVIPNGIDPERFLMQGQQEARRQIQHLAIPPEEKVILFCGRLSPEKGISVLVDSFSMLCGKMAQVRLLVVGNGPLRTEMTQKVLHCNLGKQVTFLEEVSHQEIPGLLNACDLLCLPSLREGWPNVVTEALACGTPVVASNVGGVPELLTSPEFGIMVPPRNAEALFNALQIALTRNWNREGIASAWGQRTWSVVAQELIEVLSGKNSFKPMNIKSGIFEEQSIG